MHDLFFADEVVKNDSTLFEQSIDTIIPGVPKKVSKIKRMLLEPKYSNKT